jgi:hypothetical protein
MRAARAHALTPRPPCARPALPAQINTGDNVAESTNVADGVWLDGDGPDNGAYQCSGSYDWNKLPAPYPALNATEVDAFCVGENEVQATAHAWLFANGGMDGQACWVYVNAFPRLGDPPATCAAKLRAIDHAETVRPVAFASDRTAGTGAYNDTTAAQTIAAFQLARADYWFFGINWVNSLNDTVAALLLADHGAPHGNMTNTSAYVFSREYERATVALDCETFTASFTPK